VGVLLLIDAVLIALTSPVHTLMFVRVLVVEDELRMAALLKRGLEEDGYAVDVASTGPDALWKASEFAYDAVLLDLMLPGLGGVEVCQQLRAAGRWMPVLMLTARDAIEDRVRGLDAGADDYLAKPFSFAELSARVRALIRRGAVVRPTELEVADLRLDPATRRAWRGDTELELSSKEFSLLELFCGIPGRSSRVPESWNMFGTSPTKAGRTSWTSTSSTCAARSTARSA
jgi:two-component system OmpR family response regulator